MSSVANFVGANDDNLAVIPDGWGAYGMGYGIVYTSEFPPSAGQIGAYDTSVYRTVGHGSVRIDPYVYGENTAREIDTYWIGVEAGRSHVVFSCWIKVETTLDSWHGGRIGVDFYNGGGRIGCKQSDGNSFEPYEDQEAVHDMWVYQSGSWQYRVMDFWVPSVVWKSGSDWEVPTGIICWFQAMPAEGVQCSVWFADASVQVDPSGSYPTPSPTPTGTPSATVTPNPSQNPIVYPNPIVFVGGGVPAPTGTVSLEGFGVYWLFLVVGAVIVVMLFVLRSLDEGNKMVALMLGVVILVVFVLLLFGTGIV